mmetsp:Transcript_11693/g.27007  ORF Transcript_11693/g.27007 Transcript_11693/m.27007 type:complete len:158 (-) Transcript_11693:419-892(-)
MRGYLLHSAAWQISARFPAARRAMCAPARSPLKAADRPDEQTVRSLGESARLQQKMWDTFVPEQGIRFGDTRFWGLLGIVLVLHAINTYREANAPRDVALPPGAIRRLPEGGLLMDDGSIGKEEGAPAAPHTLHVVKETGENELVLDRAWRKLKESV